MSMYGVLCAIVDRLEYLFRGTSEAAATEEVLFGIEQLKSDLEEVAKVLSAANDDFLNRKARELAYDVEDLAESFIHHQSASKRMYFSFFRSIYQKIFVEDLQVLRRRGRALVDLVSDKGSFTSNGTTALIDPHRIHEPGLLVGLEECIETLRETLIGGGSELRFISICGMGGLGKTTLARNVFDETPVRKHFDCLAWSTLTHDYRDRDILVSMLTTICQDANRSKVAAMDTLELFHMHYKSLKGKRFLIVVDDIWSANEWDSLRFMFPDNRNGSRIVLTTRSMEVAHYISASPIQMKMLTDKQSWKLFQINSGLQDNLGTSDPSIEEVGKKIVKTCRGLPLAIITIGQILSRKSLEDWKLTLPKLHSADNKVGHAMDLSYINLPSRLKACFLYLGIFPFNRSIMVEKLLLLWMSEGLISKRKEAAENYLSELVHRNLVIVEENENLLTSRSFVSCRMHDLIRDLCVTRAEQEDFFKVIDSSLADKVNSSTCRLVVHINKFEDTKNIILGIPHANRIRSILFFDRDEPRPKSKWPTEVADLTNCQSIRILDFDGVDFKVKKLPRGMGNLRYLRHLSFQGCYLEELPSTFGNFGFLETLDLRVIDSCVVTIPNVLGKLSRLRHLFFPLAFRCGGKNKLRLDQLKNLEVLENFHSGFCDAGDLRELQNLQVLGVTVDGNNLDLTNFINSIKKTKSICHSSLAVKRFDCYSKERLSIVTELLECNVLHALDLEGELGAFPHNIVFGLNFSDMVFNGSEFKGNPMKILGKLPNLKSLALCNDAFIGSNMVCYESDFPQLKSLKLAILQSLEEWQVERGAMPNLTIFTIEQCDKLEMVPSGLVEIPNLRKLMIGSMPEIFQRRVKEIIEDEISRGKEEIFSATFYDC